MGRGTTEMAWMNSQGHPLILILLLVPVPQGAEGHLRAGLRHGHGGWGHLPRPQQGGAALPRPNGQVESARRAEQFGPEFGKPHVANS